MGSTSTAQASDQVCISQETGRQGKGQGRRQGGVRDQEGQYEGQELAGGGAEISVILKFKHMLSYFLYIFVCETRGGTAEMYCLAIFSFVSDSAFELKPVFAETRETETRDTTSSDLCLKISGCHCGYHVSFHPSLLNLFLLSCWGEGPWRRWRSLAGWGTPET
jgi:hypothetical protein